METPAQDIGLTRLVETTQKMQSSRGAFLRKIIVNTVVLGALAGCGDYKSDEHNQMNIPAGKTIPRKLHGHTVEGNITIFAFYLNESGRNLPGWGTNPENGHRRLTIGTKDGIYTIEIITGGYASKFTIACSGSGDDFWYIYDVSTSEAQSDKPFNLKTFNRHVGGVEAAIDKIKK